MAYLKNDYKLMYEDRPIVESTISQNLKATKTLPAASDLVVTYKKEDGTTVDPKQFKFIKEVNGNFYGSISGKPSEATIKFSAYSGNDLLLGDEVIPPVSQFTITANKDATRENFEVSWNFMDEEAQHAEVSKTVDAGTVVRLYVEPDASCQWATEPTTCSVNGTATALTKYGESVSAYFYIDITVNANTEVIFNTGVTETSPVKE